MIRVEYSPKYDMGKLEVEDLKTYEDFYNFWQNHKHDAITRADVIASCNMKLSDGQEFD